MNFILNFINYFNKSQQTWETKWPRIKTSSKILTLQRKSSKSYTKTSRSLIKTRVELWNHKSSLTSQNSQTTLWLIELLQSSTKIRMAASPFWNSFKVWTLFPQDHLKRRNWDSHSKFTILITMDTFQTENCSRHSKWWLVIIWMMCNCNS